jgi:hypothetical protein
VPACNPAAVKRDAQSVEKGGNKHEVKNVKMVKLTLRASIYSVREADNAVIRWWPGPKGNRGGYTSMLL